jgi:hypothetical protein
VTRLIAEDPRLELSAQQADRIRLWLMALLPAKECTVARGPAAEITVPGHEPAELTPSLLRRVEEIAGGKFRAVPSDRPATASDRG